MEELIEAIEIDDVAVTEELLQTGVDPNGYEDWVGLTPLHFAAQANALQSAQLLLQAGADPLSKTADGMTPFDVAQTHSHPDMMLLLSGNIQRH